VKADAGASGAGRGNAGRAGLAVLSGLLVSLAFPNWISPAFRPWTGWVAWFGLVPLLVAMEGLPPRRAALFGWLAGFASFMSTLYWILNIEPVHPWNLPGLALVALVLGGYWGLWAAMSARAGKAGVTDALSARADPRAISLVAPAAWAGLELLRGRFFTGFPWAVLGTSQWDLPPVFLSARFVGAAGVSMVVVGLNVALWALLRRRREAMVPLIVAAVLAGSAAVLSSVAGRQADADIAAARGSVKVVLLQGAFTEEEKMVLPPDVMVRRYEQMAREAARGGKLALMVWPETATATDLVSDAGITDRLVALARGTRAVHLVGALWHDPQLHIYNGAFIVTGDGQVGAYYKSHLVPFGEYIPGWFRAAVPFAQKVTAGVVDFTPGPGPVPVVLPPGLLAGSIKVGVAVCYEAIFPEHARALALSGAEVFVNITNDAWYGRSAASYQHALGPLARAVENGRFLARCANTGVSFVADPKGRPGEVLGLFEMGTLHGTMAPIATRTFYAAHGDMVVIAVLLAALGFVAVLGAGKAGAGGPRRDA